MPNRRRLAVLRARKVNVEFCWTLVLIDGLAGSAGHTRTTFRSAPNFLSIYSYHSTGTISVMKVTHAHDNARYTFVAEDISITVIDSPDWYEARIVTGQQSCRFWPE